MPIHLRPISRRRFVGGVAAWSLSGQIGRAADSPGKWILASDTHVPANPKTVRAGVNMADNFVRILEAIRGQGRPSGMIVNGDCAYLTGSAGDYRTLVDLIARHAAAEVPLHMTLGNHDQRERFAAAVAPRLAEPKSLDVSRRVAIVETPRANWFLLDSLEVTNETPGSLGDAQRNWLTRALTERRNKPALIVAHHNISATDRVRREAKTILAPADRLLPIPGLKDTTELLDLLATQAHVAAYICGHTHQWNALDWKGITLLNLPPTAYTFLPADPNGFVRCELGTEGARFELVALDAKHPSHGQSVQVRWRQS